ncbi:hypothetical protein CDAR_485441 [Caerostris darwini]|uniref:Uncharacterized protein n=1 Tax=Caerostris darwini TaxID=1538125 RepID=A0AAV4PGD9_9ARAC|nr:hypothetical protein CDAR_485441 [Caerostris darwini]
MINFTKQAFHQESDKSKIFQWTFLDTNVPTDFFPETCRSTQAKKDLFVYPHLWINCQPYPTDSIGCQATVNKRPTWPVGGWLPEGLAIKKPSLIAVQDSQEKKAFAPGAVFRHVRDRDGV